MDIRIPPFRVPVWLLPRHVLEKLARPSVTGRTNTVWEFGPKWLRVTMPLTAEIRMINEGDAGGSGRKAGV